MSKRIKLLLFKRALSQIKQGKIMVVLYQLLRIAGFKHLLPPFPISLMIEPANICNLQCPTCPTGAGKLNRPPRLLKFQEFKHIVDQSRKYIENIVLWNYGEPFINPECLRMIKYATSSGIYVVTSTNGEFFDSSDFAIRVVKSGLHHLIICLDGADQETLSIYRKNSNFEKIIKGIQLIVAAKRKLKTKTPVLELQFIIMKQNEHQRSHIKNLSHQLGIDIYSEKTAGIDANDPEFQKQAEKFLPTDLSLSRYRLKPDGTYTLKGKIKNYCKWVYQRTVINSDGSVIPCCYDLYSRYIMGNVFEENLGSIWKNNKYQMFRKQIRKNRRSISICNICSEGRYEITGKKAG